MKRLLPLSTLVLAACSGSTTNDLDDPHDAGAQNVTDAVVLDGAPRDAGGPDRDAGPRDAGPRDGGPRDGGTGPLADWCRGQPATFSFFVTSMEALWALSGDPIDDWNGGFGGDYGGIAGADDICQQIGAATGNGDRTWRAFLSATDDGNGNPVHAIERIGMGPWFDANGLMVASGIQGLLGDRPDGDARTIDDLPNECGVPISALGDAHDIVTGSDQQGRLAGTNLQRTCNDWTSSDGNVGSNMRNGVMIGHSFPRSGRGGRNWVSDHATRGCGKGANLLQDGPGSGTCIGCSGGFGGLYCFAVAP
ncbi:MAG: hypothetical protein RMA76_42665 [Deltaproteobacteria bacterium]|jgi:hypothetical protein